MVGLGSFKTELDIELLLDKFGEREVGLWIRLLFLFLSPNLDTHPDPWRVIAVLGAGDNCWILLVDMNLDSKIWVLLFILIYGIIIIGKGESIMRKYYLFTDLEHHKDYLYWQYDHNDILGAIIAFAKKQNCDLENVRVYSFKTKTQWENYGRENFSRVALWLSTR